jgi:hypothetical protein
VLVTSDKPLAGKLVVDGTAPSTERHGGPPYFWLIVVPTPRAGPSAITFTQPACEGERGETKASVTIATRPPTVTLGPPKDGVWPALASWSPALENVYSAWIETLFDAPDGEMPSWPALH